MASSPTLHIKDSYYFEIPKFIWRCDHKSKGDFPSVWVKNDPQYQDWEAQRIMAELPGLATEVNLQIPAEAELLDGYRNWRDHDHRNFGKPLDVYLETTAEWFKSHLSEPVFRGQWELAKERATGKQAFAAFQQDSSIQWSPEKIQAYNRVLSGKILIPQPFGELKNFYERESGFCISRFMIIEALLFAVLVVVFSRVARKIATGNAPRGRVWNLFESFLLFIRDEVARKAIHDDHGHDDHGHDDHGHDDHGHDDHGHDAHSSSGHGHDRASIGSHSSGASIALRPHSADKFVPLLWTFFFFILGCNLMGMIPWLGAPTGSFAVTLALAAATIISSIIFGMLKFGAIGFWLNQIPQMELPLVLAVVIKPMIFLIEILGFFIKHSVLAIRLLANMAAGHVVLLAIMLLAFDVEPARSSTWPVMAVISLLASTAISCLELFVAFLQAYVFTFLSALFIGAATSRH